MKLRPFEVKRVEAGDMYTISVDGQTSDVKFRQEVVDEINMYHPELDPKDAEAEFISVIIQELNEEFNLTDRELQEYTQTLKYILED